MVHRMIGDLNRIHKATDTGRQHLHKRNVHSVTDSNKVISTIFCGEDDIIRKIFR